MEAAITLVPDDFGDFVASFKLTFASNLRRLMRAKDVRAKDLAEALGVTASMVTHWRNADRLPVAESMEKLREFFKVPFSEFFREDQGGARALPPTEELEAVYNAIGKLLDFEKKRGK